MKSGISNKAFAIVFMLTVISGFSAGQTRTNLNVMNDLVDSAAAGAAQHLQPEEKTIYLKFEAGKDFEVFRNRVTTDFMNSGRKIFTMAGGDKEPTVSFIINNAKVKYGDMFRHGFLGSFYLPRSISLSGSYGIYRDTAETGNFNYAYKDTVRVDSIKQIENNSYLFTKGDVPPEPFFSDLLEPIVAISTAAVAVILFFTVRSK